MIEKCIICNKIKSVHIRDENGYAICNNCYQKNRKKEKCIFCGEVRRVNTRDKKGNATCYNCYLKNKKKEKCIICGEIKSVNIRDENKNAICKSCYNKNKKKEKCVVCNKIRGVHIRDESKLAICKNCYDKNRMKIDHIFYIKTILRSRLISAFKTYSKNGKIKTSKEYGINFKQIIEKLGSKPNNNYHIDHILPCCAFNHDNQFEVWSCWHPDNLQWLLKEENLSKSNNYNENDLKNYLIKKKLEYRKIIC